MSEWLTTGEMIDKLKIGEVAKLQENLELSDEEGVLFDRVFKDNDGDILWCNEDKTIQAATPIILYGHTLNWKWRILENYVSFEEAMAALKAGKKVELHRKSYPEKTVFRNWYTLETREDLTFSDLFSGKWTIEND
ncbi:hypothetical protein [Sediminibacillus massiliensis]|uniref:hypothetical protein n=1 Tax=Sediminibacillus massiliensis TaxID=1926277 RepID=UPI0009885588|nr:hypothetical protein [Sediminibacillus massiliensis]